MENLIFFFQEQINGSKNETDAILSSCALAFLEKDISFWQSYYSGDNIKQLVTYGQLLNVTKQELNEVLSKFDGLGKVTDKIDIEPKNIYDRLYLYALQLLKESKNGQTPTELSPFFDERNAKMLETCVENGEKLDAKKAFDLSIANASLFNQIYREYGPIGISRFCFSDLDMQEMFHTNLFYLIHQGSLDQKKVLELTSPQSSKIRAHEIMDSIEKSTQSNKSHIKHFPN